MSLHKTSIIASLFICIVIVNNHAIVSIDIVIVRFLLLLVLLLLLLGVANGGSVLVKKCQGIGTDTHFHMNN